MEQGQSRAAELSLFRVVTELVTRGDVRGKPTLKEIGRRMGRRADRIARRKTIKRVYSWNKDSNPICMPAQLLLGPF